MDLMTTKEAAEFLGLDKRTLDTWRYRRMGPPYIRAGSGKKSAVRYTRDQIESWLLGNTVNPEKHEQ